MMSIRAPLYFLNAQKVIFIVDPVSGRKKVIQ